MSDDTPRLASYPWYVEDWLNSETRLSMTLTERAIYRDLLDICWRDGSLSCNKSVIKMQLNYDGRGYGQALENVLKKFTIAGDRYHHHKVDGRRNLLIGYHLSLREAGRKGGIKSGETRSSASSSASSLAQAKSKPSPSPSPSPSPIEDSLCPVVTPDARARNGTHSPPAIIPAAVNDAMFQELTGAFLSLGVALSETDMRTCAMLWVSLDRTGKQAAHAYALLQTSGEWKRRTEQFVPRPWNYLRERQWERTATAPARKAPMSKQEQALKQAAAEFKGERGVS